jgi:hypothetical protein
MSPALLTHSFIRRDHHYRSVGIRRTGDHILKELLMPWRVDDDIIAARTSELDLGRIDRDVLLLLLGKSIKDKGVFKSSALVQTCPSEPFDLSFRQRSGLSQETADHGRLPVIDVTYEDDL